MQRSWLLIVLALAGACSKKREAPPAATGSGSAKAEAPAAAPIKKIDGPSVTPVQTRAVAFVVPRPDTKWWGELNFSCYRAAMSLSGTRTAGEAFENLSPTVPGAMAAGGIDLGRDLAALGGFDCGDTPCIYAVAALAHPEKMSEVLAKLLPQSPPKTVAPGHYTLETAGMTGPRTIHVRVVPLQWTTVPSGDPWNAEAARATHVVFIGGVDGKNMDVDPLTRLADAKAARASVEDAEAVLSDAKGRCIVGKVGATGFQPGFELDRARFALAAPSGKSDPLMAMLESQRTLELVVDLELTPAAKEADVKKWTAQGRAWMGNIAAPLRVQFAGNPMLDVYFDMLAVLGERGFKHELKDKTLRLSWRTDRVPRTDLDALEARFQALLGTQP